ncbi:hypothetical protein [Terrabacter sp. RAF57]|uniref:hypothetical protein n=1 Tax=Terrabacter sp. RAF57 TaxID=3233063 RepID=UPI003F94C80D
MLWMGVVLPLVAAVFAGRLSVKGIDPFSFTIPAAVLAVIGVSVGSTVVAGAVKAHKDAVRADMIAASRPGDATLSQLVLLEEGADADRIVDLTKVQQLVITAILVTAYVASTIHSFLGYGAGTPVTGPSDISAIPDFGTTFLLLLGVSHAGYLTGKLPNRGLSGAPEDRPGYTVAERRLDAETQPRLDRRGFKEWSRRKDEEERRTRRRAAFGAPDADPNAGGHAASAGPGSPPASSAPDLSNR